MRVISLLRSAVAEPGRRLNGALVILTVIIGVVTMHSMSGSPNSHQHAAPHDASVVATQDASVAATQGVAAHDTPAPAEPEGDCCDGCGGHDAAMAMCLMILVALLALALPARRLLWRALPAWSMSLAQAVTGPRVLTAPSLHELCISRT